MSEYRQDPAQELRDLADLEALGLLDEIDQRQFERALAEITIVEQDAIRERHPRGTTAESRQWSCNAWSCKR